MSVLSAPKVEHPIAAISIANDKKLGFQNLRCLKPVKVFRRRLRQDQQLQKSGLLNLTILNALSSKFRIYCLNYA